MDLLLAGIITFFALLVGGVVLYALRSGSGGSSRSPLGLDLDPQQLIEMQLDELLAEKNAAAPEGASFRIVTKEKEAYEALKEASEKEAGQTQAAGQSSSDVPAAAASSSLTGNKALQSALLKRCIECLTQTIAYDDRIKIVYESYNQQVPRDVLHYLACVKHALMSEIDSINAEANMLRAGWGEKTPQGIFQQAMALSVGLQQRKEARAAAQQQQQAAAVDKQKDKEEEARKEAEKKRQQQKEADRAYKELMGAAPPKAAAAGKTSQKKK